MLVNGCGRDTLRQIQTFRSKSNGRDCGVTVIGTVTHRARGWKLPDMKEDRQYKQWLSKVILQDNIAIFTVPYKRCGLTKTCSSDDDALSLLLQKHVLKETRINRENFSVPVHAILQYAAISPFICDIINLYTAVGTHS